MLAKTGFSRRQSVISVCSGVLLFLSITGCSNIRSRHPDTPQRLLRDALLTRIAKDSRAANVSINLQEATYATSRTTVLGVVAPVNGLEEVPARRLPEGVDVGFIHFATAPNSEIPQGSYRLRAFSDSPRMGASEGRIALIDPTGRAVAQMPASIEVKSLTVPENPSFPRTLIDSGSERTESALQIDLTICIRCPNGWKVCWIILIDTRSVM